MLTESFFSAVCGPPLASNTAVAKDVGIYAHSLRPGYGVKSTFKKSSVPVNCLAVSDSHVFAAQHEKATVHVYSRLRGNQEAFVPLPERVRCLSLAGDVLILGTEDGRIMLWETLTGRLVSTPPCHVQAVSCLATTPYHIVSGSDDSNIHVWSLPRLLELDSPAEHEPDRSLSNHRAAVTSLVVGASTNPDTSLCVSASRDKSCIIWNYQAGIALRTVLLPAAPICLALDPGARALCISSDDSSLHLVELFGEPPLLGPSSSSSSSSAADASSAAAAAAAVTQVSTTTPFGLAPSDAGPATCLGLSYDGTILLSGHPRGRILQWSLAENSLPTELANLNAAVTNIAFVPPLSAAAATTTRAQTVVKPSQADRKYTLTAHLEADLGPETRFKSLLDCPGFPRDVLENAALSFHQSAAPPAGVSAAAAAAGAAGAATTTTPDQEDLQRQNEELLEIINEQRALYKQTLQRYANAKAGRS